MLLSMLCCERCGGAAAAVTWAGESLLNLLGWVSDPSNYQAFFLIRALLVPI